jgi:predicted DNA-binding transcriptional regulator YafY
LKLPLPPIQWKSMQCQLQPDMKNFDIIRTFVRWLRDVSHEHVSKTISKSKRLIRPGKVFPHTKCWHDKAII